MSDYPTDFAEALKYNLALSEIEKAERMARLARDLAISLASDEISHARAVVAERELEAMRFLVANPYAIQKVKDEFGPLSLWSADGLKRHDAEQHRRAIALLRSWCAGNGGERFVTKEQVRELIEATGDFLKDETT